MSGKWFLMSGTGLGAGIVGVALASVMQIGDGARPVESSSAHPELAGAAVDGGYLQAKQAYEEHWQGKICDAVHYVPGAIVAVEVHVADIRSDNEYLVDYDQQPVTAEVLVRTTSGRTRDSEELLYNDSPEANEYGECVEETTRSLVSKHVRRVTHSPFPPESVRVVLSAPRSYVRRVAEIQAGTSSIDPTAVAQMEMLLTAQLESTIVSLIPLAPPGEDTYPRVHVHWFDDSP